MMGQAGRTTAVRADVYITVPEAPLIGLLADGAIGAPVVRAIRALVARHYVAPRYVANRTRPVVGRGLRLWLVQTVRPSILDCRSVGS